MVTYEDAIAYFREQRRIYESLLRDGHTVNQTKRIMYLDTAIDALEKMKNVRETGRLL